VKMSVSRVRTRIAAFGIVVGLATTAFAASSFAGAESTSLKATVGPVPFVESNGEGFVTGKVSNAGPSTINQGVLQFLFDPGVASATFDSTCTQIANGSGVVIRVDCELGQIQPSPLGVSRVVYWVAQEVEVPTPLTISARIFYKNDPNNDTVPAPPVTHTTIVLPGRDGVDDADSACNTDSRSVNVFTNTPTLLDGQATALSYTADDIGLACYWGVVGETPLDPSALCGGVPCKTGFWFASLPEALGDLTLTIFELPQGKSLMNFVLRVFLGYPTDVVNSSVVPLCDNAGVLPNAELPACERPKTREKFGTKGGIFHLKVFGQGKDPGFAG